MPKLYTIGHSNHKLEEFLALLEAHQIVYLVDVRTIPRSRHVPWSNKDSLKAALGKRKICYTHLPELGGLRKPHKDSINLAWENPSFRGYADYMQTREFFLGLKELNQLIRQYKQVVIMCAEALPWRCHRSLIADAEIARGVTVLDIMGPHTVHQHQLTAFAKVRRDVRPIRVEYPG
jgi:uncharacterized protein (DUF488 family)